MCDNNESQYQATIANLSSGRLPEMLRIRGLGHYEKHIRVCFIMSISLYKIVSLCTPRLCQFPVFVFVGSKLGFSDSITHLGYTGNYADLFNIKCICNRALV